MEEKNAQPKVALSEKEKSDSKKYNFYRKPSIKKKVPEVKQTLTSYKRMLNANPLLKYEMEGKDLSLLSKQLQNSVNGQAKSDCGLLKKLHPEKESVKPHVNGGKPLVAKVQRSQSVKNPPRYQSRPLRKETPSIIAGSKQITGKNLSSTNISRQSNVDFNPSTSRFLSSTRLENNCSKIQREKHSGTNCSTALINNKSKLITQDNSVSTTGDPIVKSHGEKSKKSNPMRRSLSAQHFDRNKGGMRKVDQQNCFIRTDISQSLEDVSTIKPIVTQPDISPIVERSQESSITFKTPSAYERRSIAKFTPKSVLSTRRSLYCPMTPLPTLNDLQKRLNDWLVKRGKSISSFHHLKCFGVKSEEPEIFDEENKENIEVNQDLDKGSYEDLGINGCNGSAENGNSKSLILNEENMESIAKAALEDLHRLIQDGYPVSQCEGWVELIREKYKKLDEEPQYWECRAAIEQSRGNISNAVQCYRTAIVQGAEIHSVDESLDILLQKFSLLNISTNDVAHEKSVKERARIVRDARNVFKSSIIQFAVQERKLKKNGKVDNEKKLVATPVRRSTRLSRSAYTSTPGVKMCSSLQELNTSDREILDFKKNKALF